MNKKAQAAMEFLMTYGWAILVVLVAISALAYFGVLSPDNFLPERCTGPAGLDCVDKASVVDATNNVTFVLKNNIGFSLNSVTVSSVDQDCPSISSYNVLTEDTSGIFSINSSLNPTPNNRKMKVSVICGGAGFSSGRFKSTMQLSYTNANSGLQHKAGVTITGSAQ